MNNDNDAAAFLVFCSIKTLVNHFTRTKKITTIKYAFVQSIQSNHVIREL